MRFDVGEEELRRLYSEEGLSQAAIAERLGCSQPNVNQMFRKYGIRADRSRKKYVIDESEVGRLYSAGVQVKDIAAEFGCSTMPIYVILRRLGLRRRALYKRKAA